MNCSDLDRILDNHGQRSLSRADRVAVDEHLRGCSRCEPIWQANDSLAAEPLTPPAPGLFRRVLDGAADEGANAGAPARRPLLERVSIGIGLAATVLVAALVWWDGMAPNAPAAAEPGGPVAAEAAGQAGLPFAAAAFVEGEHFLAVPAGQRLVDEPHGEFIDVEEFFMYGCVHCYSFEGTFDPWCQQQPEYIRIVRVPVIFNQPARVHARAFYAAQTLGIEDRLHAALFDAIHERGRPMDNEADLEALASTLGVSAAEFREAYRSEEVTRLVRSAVMRAQEVGINATPTLVVGGAWSITPGTAGSFDAMLAVVEQLTGSEQALDPNPVYRRP